MTTLVSATAVPPALVLSAGLGTRLRPLTLVRAKPALPVAGAPMARRIIVWLAAAGVRDVVMNLHHLPETIAREVGTGEDLGVRARYSWEQPDILGSAGGVRQALDIIGAETFLIVNGDTLTDLDLAPLIAAHQSSGALVTMAVIPNTQPHRYSGLRVADDGAVIGVEPRGSSSPSSHFVGVQVAHASVFSRIPAGAAASSVGGIYDAISAERPGRIRVHHCQARFWDIGTVGDYWSTSHLFAAEGRCVATGPRPLPVGARIVDSILWDDVDVGAGASLERCIVTDGVRIPAGRAYADQVLRSGPDGAVIASPLETGAA